MEFCHPCSEMGADQRDTLVSKQQDNHPPLKKGEKQIQYYEHVRKQRNNNTSGSSQGKTKSVKMIHDSIVSKNMLYDDDKVSALDRSGSIEAGDSSTTSNTNLNKTKKTRVCFISQQSPYAQTKSPKSISKAVKQQRKTTIFEPEIMSSHRRAFLSMDRKGRQFEKTELLFTPKPLFLDDYDNDESSMVLQLALCRYLPFLKSKRLPKSSEDAYFRARKKLPVWKLVTVQTQEGNWVCYNAIGILKNQVTDNDTNDELRDYKTSGRYRREVCKVINCDTKNKAKSKKLQSAGGFFCQSCDAKKPNLRSKFLDLRRISIAMKQERLELLKMILKIDNDLIRCDAAIDRAFSLNSSQHLLDVEAEETKHDDFQNIQEDEQTLCDTTSPPTIETHIRRQATRISSTRKTVYDVDLLQNGVWQRIEEIQDQKATNNMPLLTTEAHTPSDNTKKKFMERLEQNRSNLLERADFLRGRLCVIIQIVYESAIKHIQRVLRGYYVRKNRRDYEMQLWYLASFAAACEIQRIARSFLALRRVRQIRFQLHTKMAIRIQCFMRQVLARKYYEKLYQAYLLKLHNEMAVRIQSAYRMYRSRILFRKLLGERERLRAAQERAKLERLRNASATLIQKYARGMIARRKVEERKIELQLNDRLLYLVDQFMSSGDLWTFLKYINDDYSRYESTIDTILKREDSTASIFVSKVIQTRHKQYHDAWERYFHLNSETYSNGSKHPDLRQSLGKHQKSEQTELLSLYEKNIGTNFKKALLESHVINIQQPLQHEKTQKNHILNNIQEAERLYKSQKQLQNDASGRKADNITFRKKKVLASNTHKFVGKSLHLDLPNGLDDSIDRFLRAVSIRYLNSTNMPVNMRRGLQSTNSNVDGRKVKEESILVQIMEEKNISIKIRPIIQHFHEIGIRNIRQLLPIDNMISLFEEEKCQKVLLSIIKTIVKEYDGMSSREVDISISLQHQKRRFIDGCQDIIKKLFNQERTNHFVSIKNSYKRIGKSVTCRHRLANDDNTSEDEENSIMRNKVIVEGILSNYDNESYLQDQETLPNGLWHENSKEEDVCHSDDSGSDETYCSDIDIRQETDESYRNVDAGNENEERQESVLDTEAASQACERFRAELEKVSNKYQREREQFLCDAGIDKKSEEQSQSQWKGDLFLEHKSTERSGTEDIDKRVIRKRKKGRKNVAFQQRNNTNNTCKNTTHSTSSSSWVIRYKNRVLSEANKRHNSYKQLSSGPSLFFDSPPSQQELEKIKRTNKII